MITALNEIFILVRLNCKPAEMENSICLASQNWWKGIYVKYEPAVRESSSSSTKPDCDLCCNFAFRNRWDESSRPTKWDQDHAKTNAKRLRRSSTDFEMLRPAIVQALALQEDHVVSFWISLESGWEKARNDQIHMEPFPSRQVQDSETWYFPCRARSINNKRNKTRTFINWIFFEKGKRGCAGTKIERHKER